MFSLRTSATKLARSTLSSHSTTHSTRHFSHTLKAMGVTKTVLQEGNGAIPNVGDKVTIEYTGYLKDTSKPDNKGAQ